MTRKRLRETNESIRKLSPGDLVYNILDFKSLKIKDKDHISRITDDNIYSFVIRNSVKYEVFDPEKHLKLNKTKTL